MMWLRGLKLCFISYQREYPHTVAVSEPETVNMHSLRWVPATVNMHRAYRWEPERVNTHSKLLMIMNNVE
jgi:hypothetical protein